MPPRRGIASSQQPANAGAGGSQRENLTIPEYVTFTIIQTLIAEGCLAETDAKAMIRRLMQRNTDDAYMDVISKVQQDVGFLDLAIERMNFPMTDQWYVCLLNKSADDCSKQLGSKFNPDQVQYFKVVLEALGGAAPSTPDKLLGELNQMRLLNLDVKHEAGTQAGGSQSATKKRKLGHLDKENLLRLCAQDGWLFESRQGYYSLGPRSLAELKELVLSLVSEDVAAKLRDKYM